VKILLYYVGKARDQHSNAIAEEFIKRSTRYAKCEMREIHPERFDLWTKHSTATKLLLDPQGAAWDSARFTAQVKSCEDDARDLVLVIGGSDGLPSAWRSKGTLVALSPMTMPHELARAVLAEQIYRALTTLRGHPYPR